MRRVFKRRSGNPAQPAPWVNGTPPRIRPTPNTYGTAPAGSNRNASAGAARKKNSTPYRTNPNARHVTGGESEIR